jgi:hypothetical protein
MLNTMLAPFNNCSFSYSDESIIISVWVELVEVKCEVILVRKTMSGRRIRALEVKYHSFTLQQLYLYGKSPRYPLSERLGGPQSGFGCGD